MTNIMWSGHRTQMPGIQPNRKKIQLILGFYRSFKCSVSCLHAIVKYYNNALSHNAVWFQFRDLRKDSSRGKIGGCLLFVSSFICACFWWHFLCLVTAIRKLGSWVISPNQRLQAVSGFNHVNLLAFF